VAALSGGDAAATERPGPLERALLATWPEVTRRLRQPRSWLKALRLRSQFRLSPLRRSQVRVIIPARQVPDCEACEEVCCAGPTRTVSLRLLDIAALIDAGLESAITHERPRFSVAQRDRNPALDRMIRSPFWSCFPVLRQDRTGTCSLLDEKLACRAHPAWPLSCARYPFSLNLGAQTVFWAPACKSPGWERPDALSPTASRLVDATLRAYNERIRDIVMLTVARDLLVGLGLDSYLKSPER